MSGLVAGFGFSSRANGEEIAALVRATLAAAELPPDRLDAVATLDRKAAEEPARDAAAALGVPLLPVSAETMAQLRVPSPSRLVACHAGIPGVAEAAALAFGELVLPKRKSAHATCAISRRIEP